MPSQPDIWKRIQIGKESNACTTHVVIQIILVESDFQTKSVKNA